MRALYWRCVMMLVCLAAFATIELLAMHAPTAGAARGGGGVGALQRPA